jgi:hypothetical protein
MTSAIGTPLRSSDLRHLHHGVGGERVADENDRPVIAAAVTLRNLVDDSVGLGVIIDRGFDAVLVNG